MSEVRVACSAHKSDLNSIFAFQDSVNRDVVIINDVNYAPNTLKFLRAEMRGSDNQMYSGCLVFSKLPTPAANGLPVQDFDVLLGLLVVSGE